MAYTVVRIATTPSPCRGAARLGRTDQVELARSYAQTVLYTVPMLSPPATISWPPTIAAPASLILPGAACSWTHRSAAGSKRCTAAVLEVTSSLRPPTAYTYRPSDAAAR